MNGQGWETMKTEMEVTSIKQSKQRENLLHTQHSGQGLAEYSLIISFVAVAVVFIATLLGSRIKQALCEPLIAINPEFTTSCVGEPDNLSSQEGEETGNSIAVLAVYSASRGKLYIAARPSGDTTASVSVDGYGPMQYILQKDAFVLVIDTDHPPATVTLRSSEGATMTVDVMRK
ncbi:MAG: hypothetical protein A2Z14_10480 [Chloroflexi bacterium RBG_16_48_8]|nr:MAG: hypothetical protein A2Z14_10480 [Chloroflexi bacterium RBG_16_48_8]